MVFDLYKNIDFGVDLYKPDLCRLKPTKILWLLPDLVIWVVGQN